MTLAEFLLARVDDDEAKRRIVNLHNRSHHQCVAEDGPTQWHASDPCATLRLLALLYADHPDYRPEWRPEQGPDQK